MRLLLQEISPAPPEASPDPPPPPVPEPEPPSPPVSSPDPPSPPVSSPDPPPPPVSSPDPPPPPVSSPPPPRTFPPPPLRRGPPPPRHPPPPHRPRSDQNGEAQSESISIPMDTSNVSEREKAIIGTAIGLGLFMLTIFVIICVCCCRRKKRRDDRDDRIHYYQDHHKSQKTGGANYYNDMPQRHWQQHNTGYMDGKMKYHPPPPPPSSSMSSEHWMPAGPPPPPPMSLSSGGFSGPTPPPPHPGSWSGYKQSTFSYNDLAAATGRFAQANLLGQGGFGYVHKGVLPNGKEVAVKSLKLNSGQGEREFQAEVDIISRVHHRHLVSLVGYCISGSQRMLVYEYVSNSTLEYHLHGAGRPTMDWTIRLRIALGAAKGFAYLHEDCHPRIIHRDIKAANILLDNNFEAKVADFGLAKLSSDNNTHVSTRIMGTFGYLAPEYASSGKLTEKSDVYSFGIVLLELITGRRPVDVSTDDDDTLVDRARPIFMKVAEGGSYEELVDPRLENKYDHGEMLRMVSSAAACIRPSSRKRPKMSQVVRALEGDVSLDDMSDGMKAVLGHGSLSASSSEYDLQRLQSGSEYSNSSGASSNEINRPTPSPGPHL